jgi:hypothetical protein
MTKIKQYELDSTIHEDDKVIGTDGNPGVDLGRTKNFTIAALTAYLNTALEVDNMIGGSGTLNTIPMWTPDGTTLGDSIIVKDASVPAPDNGIVVKGKFRIDTTGTATDIGSIAAFSNTIVFNKDLELNAGLKDYSDSLGTAGQALLSTSTATEWSTFYLGYAQQASDVDIKFGYNNGGNNTTHAVRVYAGSGITLTENAPLGFEISADSQVPSDNVTGTGTLNTVPLWTPDGQTIGDSWLTQEVIPGISINYLNFEGPSGFENRLKLINGYIETNDLQVTNITAGDTGIIDLQGSTTLGNSTSDVIWHRGTTYLTGPVLDTSNTAGTSGQILISDGSSQVLWADQTNTTYDLDSIQTGSDVAVTLVGSDATIDTLTLVAGSSITLTDDGGNNITIDGVGDTTYTHSSAQDGSNAVIRVTDGVTNQDVTLVAGNSISLTDDGSNNITIAATGGAANTTYDLVGTYNTNDTILTLQGSDATSDTFTLHAGSGISFGQDAVNGITTIDFNITDNVTGSGTLNTIPLWTPDGQTLGDSSITLNAQGGATINTDGYGDSGATDELTVIGIDSKIVIQSNTAGSATLVGKPNFSSNRDLRFEVDINSAPGRFTWNTPTSEYMRLNTTQVDGTGGNLGIGTTAPYYRLHTAGSNNGIYCSSDTGVGGETTFFSVSRSQAPGTSTFLYAGSGNFVFGPNGPGTQDVLITGDLEVGGTITAAGQLHLQDALLDQNSSSGSSDYILKSTGTGNVEWVDPTSLTGVVSGTGTAGKLPYWNPDGTTLADSLITQTSDNSITIGVGATATGSEAISLSRSTARADYSFAHGYESITDGEFSVTLGKGGYTAGDHSAAIGYKGISLGQSAISGGHSSSAGGDGAVALGHNASAGNYGVAKATNTFPNDQTTFDIYGIVGTVAVGTFLRYGPGFDVADPRIEVTQFTDLGNGAATITIASGIRPIAGELLVFEEETPQRNDHQGGVALGNDAFSLGQAAVALGQDAVADADFAVAIGRTASTSTQDSIALGGGSTKILIQALVYANSYADDTAAAAGGVAIGELYRNGNVVQIRLT